MRRLATRFRVPLIYWSTEDPNCTDVFTLPLLKRMKPDYIFTISAKSAERLRKLGLPAAHMDYAYRPKVHYRTGAIRKFRTDIAVVANAYPDVLGKYKKL